MRTDRVEQLHRDEISNCGQQHDFLGGIFSPYAVDRDIADWQSSGNNQQRQPFLSGILHHADFYKCLHQSRLHLSDGSLCSAVGCLRVPIRTVVQDAAVLADTHIPGRAHEALSVESGGGTVRIEWLAGRRSNGKCRLKGAPT